MVDVRQQDDFGLALLDDLDNLALEGLDPFRDFRQVLDSKYVPLGFKRTLEGNVTVYSGSGGNKVPGETSVRFWIERGTPRYEIVRNASWRDDPERRGERQLTFWNERSDIFKLPHLVRDLECWHDNGYSVPAVHGDLDCYAFLDKKHDGLYVGNVQHNEKVVAVMLVLADCVPIVCASINMRPQAK